MTIRAIRALTRLFAAGFLAGTALLGGAHAQDAGFIITYTDDANEGFNDPTLGAARRACLEAVAANWASHLEITVPIEIEASMDPLGGTANSAVLGRAGAYWIDWDFPGAPLPGVMYPGALANQLAGKDLAPEYPEIIIQYNSDVDGSLVMGAAGFNYQTNGVLTISGGYYNIDFYQTCYHEIGHGLGFYSELNQNGTFSNDLLYPGSFDVHLRTGPEATSPRMVDLTATQRASALVSDALYFAGTNARAASGGTNARIYAPTTFRPGSSRSHLREESYTGNYYSAELNELMTPMLGPGVMHHPGPIVSGVFQDIGWRFKPYTIADVATGLRAIAGFAPTTESDLARLQRHNLANYPGRLTMPDVIQAVRAAAGTEPSPHIIGSR